MARSNLEKAGVKPIGGNTHGTRRFEPSRRRSQEGEHRVQKRCSFWHVDGRTVAGAALVVVAGLSLSVDQAWAQAREESVTGRIRPEYDPLGLPLDLLFWETGRVFSPDSSRPREGQTALGSFIVYPSLSTELEFTDNVYDEENGQNSDFIFRTTPLVRLESDWDNHFLAVEGGLTYGKYFSQSSEDYVDLLAATDFRIDVTEEVLLNGRLEWRQGHESRGDADDPGAAFDVTVLQR